MPNFYSMRVYAENILTDTEILTKILTEILTEIPIPKYLPIPKYVACPKSPVTHTFYSEHIAGTVATISVHQRLLFTMDNSRCGRNDFCPLVKWTIVVEHVDIKIIFNDYCSFS